MARHKHTEAEGGQGMFLTVNLKEQLLPGTFELIGEQDYAVDGADCVKSNFKTLQKKEKYPAAFREYLAALLPQERR
jgi:hypothetical protein